MGILAIVTLTRNAGYDRWLALGLVELATAAVVYVSVDLIEKETGGRIEKRRCKYCGHYTQYIPPNHSFAYLFLENHCRVCGRGYPMPTAFWDSEGGKAYMYERGSVCDPEFYATFELEHPQYPHSKQADHYLGREPADGSAG